MKLKSYCSSFLKGFSESERNKLAILTGVLLANGTLNASILNSLYNENLVKEGASAAFAVKLFKSWINEKDINVGAASLRKVSMDNRLMELFPANKQSVEHFTKYFTEAGLKELLEYELQKELQEHMSRGDPFKDIILYVKEEMKKITCPNRCEEPILKWYKDAHVAKGKSVFLGQMKKFAEWLKNAEEESESEVEEGD
uniref:W2 domain-containing protein n=1 Tax=Peromyscus maniculatus bairdii TaxID=230844 RepID=A0A8C8UKV7_PERMB